jgi:hypothetical protein
MYVLQDTELNAEFEKASKETPAPTRWLRSQKPVAAAEPSSTAAVSNGDGTVVAPVARVVKEQIDPWDMLDPVDVLARLPANFQENMDSKKWTERKDALQALCDLLTSNPRLS